MKTVTLLDVKITNETVDTICHYIFDRLQKTNDKWYIVTPNPEMLVLAHKRSSFKKLLNHASLALPDGVGVFLAAGLLGDTLKERIPGVDFMEELCRRASKKPVSIGFLGAGPGVAKKTAECLIKKYPGLKARWVGQEWHNVRDDKTMMQYDIDPNERMPYISEHDPLDILFVAFGAPKQEEWIAKHLPQLPVKMCMGVGGSFDYISGEVVRAPFMLRAIGLEWLFRLLVQPWRMKRQFALVEFIFLLIKELFQRERRGKKNAK